MLSRKEVDKLQQQIAVHKHYWKGKDSPEFRRWQSLLETDAQQEEKVRRWFKDSDTWVGVFENQALDHSQLGARVAFIFASRQREAAQVGHTRAPDTKTFLGWAYILVAVCHTPEEALAWLRHDETDSDRQKQSEVAESADEIKTHFDTHRSGDPGAGSGAAAPTV